MREWYPSMFCFMLKNYDYNLILGHDERLG